MSVLRRVNWLLNSAESSGAPCAGLVGSKGIMFLSTVAVPRQSTADPRQDSCALTRHSHGDFTTHGTVFTAGSLHAPWPAAPTARTRTQMRCPLVNPFNTALDFVTDRRFA